MSLLCVSVMGRISDLEFQIWNFGLRISCWRHSYETGRLIALDSRLNLARHEIRNPKFQIRNRPT